MLVLLGAQFKKEFIYFRRYFFNSIGSLVTLYVVFLLIFLGYRGLAGGAEWYGTGLSSLIVGYVLWTITMVIYQDISYTLFNEAREGVLEQLYMSPFGYTMVTMTRLLAGLIFNLLFAAVILLASILSTGRTVHLNLPSLLPLIFLLLMPIVGLGFTLGGLQLIFKRIQSFLQVVQFLLIGIIAAPISMGWTRLLPGSLASNLIRKVMVENLRFFDLALLDIIQAGIVALAYFYFGYLIFKICERKSMEQGRLAQF